MGRTTVVEKAPPRDEAVQAMRDRLADYAGFVLSMAQSEAFQCHWLGGGPDTAAYEVLGPDAARLQTAICAAAEAVSHAADVAQDVLVQRFCSDD